MKTYQETKKKTSCELLFIEVIKKAFSDSFSIGNASDPNQSLSKMQAKNWIDLNRKDFRYICELAGAEPDYILKLYQNLEYNYNSGKITKEKLKLGISRLELKF
tara:strand:- start:655 stop:966 length:312 start_codon:yes stop_codon:yes gene_type:complete